MRSEHSISHTSNFQRQWSATQWCGGGWCREQGVGGVYLLEAQHTRNDKNSNPTTKWFAVIFFDWSKQLSQSTLPIYTHTHPQPLERPTNGSRHHHVVLLTTLPVAFRGVMRTLAGRAPPHHELVWWGRRRRDDDDDDDDSWRLLMLNSLHAKQNLFPVGVLS